MRQNIHVVIRHAANDVCNAGSSCDCRHHLGVQASSYSKPESGEGVVLSDRDRGGTWGYPLRSRYDWSATGSRPGIWPALESVWLAWGTCPLCERQGLKFTSSVVHGNDTPIENAPAQWSFKLARFYILMIFAEIYHRIPVVLTHRRSINDALKIKLRVAWWSHLGREGQFDKLNACQAINCKTCCTSAVGTGFVSGRFRRFCSVG